MKTSNLVQFLSVMLLLSAPFMYAAWIWNVLPDTVPTHFGIDGKPDAFGTKSSTLTPVVILMMAGLGVYFLMKNIEKFDPKRAQHAPKDTFDKIAMLILMLMSGLSIYIIHSTLENSVGNFLFVLLGLFFAALGNFMHSLQPNYFVGIRVPWTLENPDNWRKTHQLASKIWFAGGLAIAILALFLSEAVSVFVFFGMIAVMTLIPIVFSYQEYKKKA